jgi:prenylcysteine oxidase / farnesylcysteine lyase
LAPFATDRIVAAAVRNFTAIYARQAEGRTFATAAELWGDLGMLPLSRVALAPFLAAQLSIFGWSPISKVYVREVVAAQTHANYNQPPSDISALVGLIALAPDGTTFTVANGTAALPAGLLRKSGAALWLGAPVHKVSHAAEGRWEVHVAGRHPEVFDAVLIAAPLGHAQLDVRVPGRSSPVVPKQPYQPVVTTLVRGNLSAAYFGHHPIPPGFIATTQGTTAPFRAIGTLEGASGYGRRLVKIFSRDRLPRRLLDAMFVDGRVEAEHPWLAYPHYSPPEQFADFQIAEGLYYLNGIEAGASCIEISAIAARNAAMLAAAHLRSRGSWAL